MDSNTFVSKIKLDFELNNNISDLVDKQLRGIKGFEQLSLSEQFKQKEFLKDFKVLEGSKNLIEENIEGLKNIYQTDEVKNQIKLLQEALKEVTSEFNKMQFESTYREDIKDKEDKSLKQSFKDLVEKIRPSDKQVRQEVYKQRLQKAAVKTGFDKENLNSLKTQLLTSLFPKAKLANLIIEPFIAAIDKITSVFEQSFKDAIKELSEVASYSLGTSTTYNQEAVNLGLSYGLTGKEAYAFQNALKDTGMISMDNLMTAQMMGMQGVLTSFKERFDDYMNSYEDSIEIARETQEFQKEWQDFRRGLMQEFMQFFTDNKDVIIGALEFTTTLLSGILNGISAIIEFIGGPQGRTEEERIKDANEIIYGESQTNTYNNDSRSYTYNNNFYTPPGSNAQDIARYADYYNRNALR